MSSRNTLFPAIDRLHRQTGAMLLLMNRCLLVCSLMGLVFVAGLVPLHFLFQQPQALLQTQAFEINYGASLRLKQQDIATDPVWDGTLSGMSLGYTYLQGFPLIGVVLGPVVGGFVGYTLDKRI